MIPTGKKTESSVLQLSPPKERERGRMIGNDAAEAVLRRKRAQLCRILVHRNAQQLRPAYSFGSPDTEKLAFFSSAFRNAAAISLSAGPLSETFLSYAPDSHLTSARKFCILV